VVHGCSDVKAVAIICQVRDACLLEHCSEMHESEKPGLKHEHWAGRLFVHSQKCHQPYKRYLIVELSSPITAMYVGIMSSCLLLAFLLLVSSCRHVYVASASQYLSRIHNCARLLIVATQSNCLNCPNRLLIKVRSHGNNVRDVIIVCVIIADAQIYKQTWKTPSNLRTNQLRTSHTASW